MATLDVRSQRDALASVVMGLRGLRTAICHQLIAGSELDDKRAAADRLYRCQQWIDRVRGRLDELVLPGLPVVFRLGAMAASIRACIADGLTGAATDLLVHRIADLALRLRDASCAVLDAPTRDALGAVLDGMALEPRELPAQAPVEAPAEALDDTPWTIEDAEAAMPWPEVAITPARPREVLVRSRQDCADDLVERLFEAPSSEAADALTLRHGLHGLLFNVEITAMESCAMMLARFPEIPEACAHDLARQCWDESRHAQICRSELELRGGRLDEFPVHLAVWDKARRGATAAECLCLQQVLGEGFALGQGLRAQRDAEARGDRWFADLHERLFFDELLHVRNGVRWFRALAGRDAGAVYNRICAELGRTVDVTVGDEIAEFALLHDVTGASTAGERQAIGGA